MRVFSSIVWAKLVFATDLIEINLIWFESLFPNINYDDKSGNFRMCLLLTRARTVFRWNNQFGSGVLVGQYKFVHLAHYQSHSVHAMNVIRTNEWRIFDREMIKIADIILCATESLYIFNAQQLNWNQNTYNWTMSI